jgi:hypothetical protein
MWIDDESLKIGGLEPPKSNPRTLGLDPKVK